MTKILFQGDSITDCGRSREDDSNKGRGYATLVMSELGFDAPGKYEFVNRAVSANKITDLYARIKADIINLKPDVMSILIGVNDIWQEVKRQDGVCAEKFEKIYDMLISEVKQALPDIKIMILAPYVTKSTATDGNWEVLSSGVAKRAEAAKRIADKYGLTYVPLQGKFDEMVAKQPEPYWTWEGVHPSEYGHELIAREWIKAFKTR